ncbi:MAG: OPT/YSL family transporter [Streptococcaceae bacterium]|nr:OPT/YSL family transporter [Streptococcaceae bacterium]
MSNKHLSKSAYGGVAGKDYIPYEDGHKKKAGNLIVLVLGIILAVLFASSTAYSGMKAGLTVAAGIPGAILGSGLLSIFIRKNNFLMKNILQAMATGGESIASGIIFVLPAVILIGGKVNFFEGIFVGIAAVLFGIGVMAFVQDYLFIEEHGKLIYPEAMAISETLVASDTGGDSLKFMGIGFGIGGIITTLTSAVFGVLNNNVSYVNEKFYKWKFDIEVNPMLSAIGFIVGLQISVMMFAGSILANFAIAPLIGYFAEMAQSGHTVWNNPSVQISAMQFADISGSYVKYIGAGMMISGGLIGAIKLIPTIVASVKATLAGRKSADKTESDPVGIVAILLGIVLAFVAGIVISGGNIAMAFLAGLLSLILSMLFVIVAGRLVGTIGTSNLPVSGMTIASLVILTLVFFTMGWTSTENLQSLLLFGTFIVTAISVSGGYSQAQKVTFVTGGNMSEVRRYYLGAAALGVLAVTGIIIVLRDQLASGSFALPQANLMATLTQGILSGNLPWNMIIAGIVMGIVLQLLGLSIMTVAIGFYLPISTSSIILIGALVRVFIETISQKEGKGVLNARIASGVSLSSGLVAGSSILGLVGIILQVSGVITVGSPVGFLAGNGIAWILLVVLVISMIVPLLSVKTGLEHPED